MEDWLKIIVPVIVTGMGVIIFELFSDVRRLESTLLGNKEYIYRIEQNEIKIKELQIERRK